MVFQNYGSSLVLHRRYHIEMIYMKLLAVHLLRMMKLIYTTVSVLFFLWHLILQYLGTFGTTIW